MLGLSCARRTDRSPEEIARALAGSTVGVGETPALACPSAVVPYPPYSGVVKLGSLQLAQAHSDANRGLFLFSQVGAHRVPTLALQMYLAGEGIARGSLIQTRHGVFAGNRFIPTDWIGEVLVSPREPSTITRLSMIDLVRAMGDSSPGRLPAALAAKLAGKYVLVGNTAIELNDLGRSNSGELIPLVLMHASLLSDLLEGTPIAPVPLGLTRLLVFLIGALAFALALGTRPMLATGSIAVLLSGVIGAELIGLRHGFLLAPLAPLAGTVIGAVAAITSRMVVRERERGILRTAFGSYVDAAHLERILDAPDRYLALAERARRSACCSPTCRATPGSPTRSLPKR